MHIRKTTLEDIPQLKQLDIYYEHHKNIHLEAIQKQSHHSAWIGETMIGDIIFDYKLYGNCLIRLVHTHKEYRRQGIATSLIQYAEKQCRYDKIFISTQISNTQMNALLNKIGYISCGYIKLVNEDPEDDELFFYKSLKK